MATHQQIDKSRSSSAARANKSKPQAGAHPAQILQRLEDAPGSIRPADILQLQRTIGNQATGRLLQAKLKLGPAGDVYEQEADRVAQQVVHASRQPEVQRADMDEDELQAKPLAAGISRVQRADLDEEELQAKPRTDRISQLRRAYLATAGVQRAGMEEEELQAKRTFAASPSLPKVQRAGMEEEELQAAPNHGLEGGDVDTDVARSIQSAKGGGAPLHDGVRSSMEQGFGADFSGVRVHTGGESDALNRSLNARAFTTGNDIFFGSGEYNPGSSGGQELIAHELTHTVQQGAAGAQRETIQRRVTNINWGNATQAKPSTSGVKGGVFFITVGGTMHVVKATANVGATKFAEQLLGMLGGQNIATSDSTPVPQADNEFAAIMQAIQQFRPAQPQRNAFNSDQEFQEASQKHQAYVTKYNAFQQSPYVLIQQNMFTPGTQVLGVEDLSVAIQEAGGNKGALQGRVDTDVQAQVNLLTNQTLMKAVGRLLAIDTLFGNADRFEEMNVQNAFMRGDNTIGAIDTEAIMQSLTGTTQFSSTEIGSGAVPAGGSEVIRYVDFVIGNLDTGGGRNISDEWAGTPTSNVAKVLTTFDGWFEKTFAVKFLAWQDQMVTDKFDELGFPRDGKTGNWPAVKQLVRQGLDEGLQEVTNAMSGAQYNQIKQNYQNLTTQYGGDDNFDWDALKIRGEYMSAIQGGSDHQQARQMIIDRLTRRENAKQNVGVGAKVMRILNFGTTNGLLTPKEGMQIKKIVPQIAPNNLKKMLHISNRGGLKKKGQGLIGSNQSNTDLNNRLEAARVQQLKNLAGDVKGGTAVVTAVTRAVALADRLRKKDVDQVVYRTKAGRLRARNALAMIGVDVNRWGPPLN